MKLIDRPSPNYDERRPPGHPVDMLILHYTGMPTAEDALCRMCDRKAAVSAHYLVDEDGQVVSLVSERYRAWHAGKSHWAGAEDINFRSIGIEIVNPGHEFGYRPFPDAQIEAVIALSHEILARHPIPAERVLGHSDVAPTRKEDPGELFPWARLADQGVGRFVDPQTVSTNVQDKLAVGAEGDAVRNLQDRFKTFGYGIEITGVFDAATEAVVTAFQRHFRPKLVDGIADGECQALLDAYLSEGSSQVA